MQGKIHSRISLTNIAGLLAKLNFRMTKRLFFDTKVSM